MEVARSDLHFFYDL